jgi:ABC-type phosphonate transport system ATPase subunit
MRILRGLSSKYLPCGCLAGVYETYDGTVVAIVDAKGTGCATMSHREGKRLPNDAVTVEPKTADSRAQ